MLGVVLLLLSTRGCCVATADESVGKQAVAFMSRHLVALQVDCEYDDGETQRRGSEVFSGFILDLHGRRYWTTAGHCLRDVDAEIGKGHLRVHGGGFADFFGPGLPNRHLVPFTYERGLGIYVCNDDLGLDFGVILLPDLLALNIQANNIVPISRENWVHQSSLTFSFYKMLGFPSHLIEELGGYVPTMIGIEPIDPSSLEDAPAGTWFAGRIPAEVPVNSIKGMSGGPIYGFRRGQDGGLYYHVVAIQSRWREKSRIVFGCSVPFVAEKMHEALSGGQP